MFTIYSKPNCPQCVIAKNLLSAANIEFNEIHIDTGQEKHNDLNYISRDAFIEKFPNQRMLPLILKDELMIKSVSELKALL